jgi:hypothetical protein
MTILIHLIIFITSKERMEPPNHNTKSVNLTLISYFFFALATHNLCALLVVRTFALEPEKKIRYGLESDALSFASHIMTQLVLGWLLLF